jgi:hypothetical protein
VINDEDDALRVEELIAAPGGTWKGLLFDNPRFHRPASLTWTFRFLFQDVDRSYGDSPVSLEVDWVPLTTRGWHHMTGQSMRCDGFAEPAESSLYFFEHHRFESIDLRIVEQRERSIHVICEVAGDADRLGIERVSVDSWLVFTGIHVQLSDATTEDAALTRLAEFTDTTGLVPATRSGPAFPFAPA